MFNVEGNGHQGYTLRFDFYFSFFFSHETYSIYSIQYIL